MDPLPDLFLGKANLGIGMEAFRRLAPYRLGRTASVAVAAARQ